MNKYNIERLCNLCPLLKNECIKKEVESYLEGFYIDNKAKTGMFELSFKDKDDNRIELFFKSNNLVIFKYTNNSVERSIIYNNFNMIQRKIEKRDNNLIILDISKKFDNTIFSNSEKMLVELNEKKYVLDYDILNKMLPKIDFKNILPVELLLNSKFDRLDLRTFCDFYSCFLTNINSEEKEIYSTNIYFNDEDVSYLYDVLYEKDMLYKIYDIHNKLINTDDIFYNKSLKKTLNN